MNQENDKSNVKKLTAEEVVKANPKIYWGVDLLTNEAINSSIISALKEDDCKKLNVHEIFGWQVISSDTNWFLSLNKSVDELFDTTYWIPGGGGNDLRFEYFLKIVASNVCVFERNHLYRIKGTIDDSLSLEFVNIFKNKTVVAYRL